MRDSHLISRRARDCVRANRKCSGRKSACEPIARKLDVLPPLRPIADMTSSPRYVRFRAKTRWPAQEFQRKEACRQIGGLCCAKALQHVPRNPVDEAIVCLEPVNPFCGAGVKHFAAPAFESNHDGMTAEQSALRALRCIAEYNLCADIELFRRDQGFVTAILLLAEGARGDRDDFQVLRYPKARYRRRKPVLVENETTTVIFIAQ